MVAYTLPVLPYPTDALEPVVSKETLAYHHGKHFAAYVNNLNKLIPGSEYEGMLVEEIVREAADGPIYDNAGQVMNHRSTSSSLSPHRSTRLRDSDWSMPSTITSAVWRYSRSRWWRRPWASSAADGCGWP